MKTTVLLFSSKLRYTSQAVVVAVIGSLLPALYNVSVG